MNYDDETTQWCPTCENVVLQPEDCGECPECVCADGAAAREIWELATYFFNHRELVNKF
jgi:hypothetical protein